MNKAAKFDKFVFETDFFEVEVDEQENDAENRAITEEDLAQAQAKSYAEGLEKGQQQALEQFKSELQTYLTPLQEKLNTFAEEKNALHKIMEQKSIAVAANTVDILFAHLKDELGEETLAKAIAETLEKTVKDVTIVVKVNQKAYDFLTKHEGLNTLIKHKDATLKVDERLAQGEAAIVWEDAGATIDLLGLTKEIQTMLHEFVPKRIPAYVEEETGPTEEIGEPAVEAAPAEQVEENNPETVTEDTPQSEKTSTEKAEL
jgi:flagellar biosynthesis/type III secretory pathway protein FliH